MAGKKAKAVFGHMSGLELCKFCGHEIGLNSAAMLEVYTGRAWAHFACWQRFKADK